MKKHLLILALCTALSACAATGETYSSQALPSPAKGKAQLVIYRPSAFLYGGSHPPVEINGVEKCDIANGSFMVVDADPGTTTISVSIWDLPGVSKLSIKTKPHSRYFVRAAPSSSKVFGGILGGEVGLIAQNSLSENKGQFSIQEVDKKIAQQELHGLKQSLTCK